MKAFLFSLGVHFALFLGLTGFWGLSKTETASHLPNESLALQWNVSPPSPAHRNTTSSTIDTRVKTEETREISPLTDGDPIPAGNPETSADRDYYARLRSRIQSQVKYPSSLARRHIQGQVVLGLAVKNDGSLSELRLEHSSGHAELDRIALESVRSAAPFETPPAALHLSVPIDFRAR